MQLVRFTKHCFKGIVFMRLKISKLLPILRDQGFYKVIPLQMRHLKNTQTNDELIHQLNMSVAE